MSLQPGQMLSHYRLVKQIGEGGMGVVWKAEDTTLEREVAIKVLPDAFALFHLGAQLFKLGPRLDELALSIKFQDILKLSHSETSYDWRLPSLCARQRKVSNGV